MDPQFQELAAQITRDVTDAVTRNVTEAVTRDVTEAVTRNVTEAVKRDVTEALKEHVTDVVSAAERRLTEHAQVTLDAAERRLTEQARVNVEAVKSEAQLAAEGYAGVVESINTRLTRIETRLDDQSSLYDHVLKNHHDRIAALEHPQSSTPA